MSRIQRADLNPALIPTRLPGPRQPRPLEALQGVGFQRICILFVYTPTEAQPLYPGHSCQKLLLRGFRCRKTKGIRRDETGEQGKAREKPLCAQGTSGSCLCPAAPAKLQNNGAQAAKPKSGAKNPWNVRPGAPGHTELPPQRGPFFCRERVLGWQSASQPGFHTCARLPGTRGLDEDEWQGKAAGLFGSLTCLDSNPGPASFNHAVSVSSSGKWG